MEKYEYPSELIPIEDVLEGKAKLPDGIEWYTYSNGFKWFVTNPEKIKKTQESKEIVGDFIMRVSAEDFSLLKSLPNNQLKPDIYSDMRIGNYVVNDLKTSPQFIQPTWFNGAIVRISKIAIMMGYLSGVGIRKNHGCAYRKVGWESYNKLHQSIVKGIYKIFDKNTLENYCREEKIELVPNFESVDFKFPLKTDRN